jgi:hypothetical protein
VLTYIWAGLPCLFSDTSEPPCIFTLSSTPANTASVEQLCPFAAAPWETQDASSMNDLRAAADLSAPPALTSLAKPSPFLHQDRRRTPAPQCISITTANLSTPRPHTLSIAASQRPRPRRPSSRHLDLRQASLLAVEAPLKRRRKQVLLLPTNTRHPP